MPARGLYRGHGARQWKPAPDVLFRWKHARQSIAACRRPVLLDLGDGTVLRAGRFAASAEMERDAVHPRVGRGLAEGWHALGTHHAAPAVTLSRYDPPWQERYRTPDAWRTDQEQRRRWVFGTGELPASKGPGPRT